MATVTINGVTYEGGNTNSFFSVQAGGIVTIDGVQISEATEQKTINIEVTGDIAGLSLQNCNKITVVGDVGGIGLTNGDIDVSGDVGGNVSVVSGDVKVGNVAGSVSTVTGDISNKNV